MNDCPVTDEWARCVYRLRALGYPLHLALRVALAPAFTVRLPR